MEFQYTASDKKGRHVSAITNADSIHRLISDLKKQGLIPLQVSKVKSDKLKGARRGKVKGKELAIFTRQLATVLNAGILLIDSLNTIADDMENLYFRGIIQKIVEDISGGKSLSQALSQYQAIFPQAFVAVVKSGEEIGNLGKTLADLAKYLEESEKIKEKLKNALRYPLFLLSFLIFVVAVIVLFIIPKFKVMFTRAGMRLPLLTRIVVGASEFCLKNIHWLLIILAIVGFLFWRLLKLARIRFWFDSFKLKAPLVGQIIREAIISRFCRTFSILLAGGVTIASALEVSAEVINNVFLRQIVEQIRNSVISGVVLGEAMKPQEVFPRLVVKMVAVGEKSGELNEMLERSADYYDDKLKTSLDGLSALIEPVFIVLIGAVVLVVVLALYLPIFKISATVH